MAKELAKAGKKKQAILALKKKKMQEQMLSKAEASLENVQTMVDSVEFAEMEARVFEGLKAGNEVLKELNEEMSIEKVENLMEETREAMEYQDVRQASSNHTLTTFFSKYPKSLAQDSLKMMTMLLWTNSTTLKQRFAVYRFDSLKIPKLSGVDKMPEAPTHELKAQEPEEGKLHS